jgi:hypothetical protein
MEVRKMAENVSWDDIDFDSHDVSEEEYKKADERITTPIGRFECTCKESVPQLIKGDKESYYAVNLKWEIDRVLEHNGVPTYIEKDGQVVANPEFDSDAADEFLGRKIFDTVPLPKASEKDAVKNRRILIAKRLGLIGAGNMKISKDTFMRHIIEKQAILTTEEQSYEKNGKKKTIVKVAFDGYAPLEDANKEVDYGDI